MKNILKSNRNYIPNNKWKVKKLKIENMYKVRYIDND